MPVEGTKVIERFKVMQRLKRSPLKVVPRLRVMSPLGPGSIPHDDDLLLVTDLEDIIVHKLHDYS